MLPHYRVLILLMGRLHPKQDSCIAASEAICCPASDPMCSNRCPCLAAPPPPPLDPACSASRFLESRHPSHAG